MLKFLNFLKAVFIGGPIRASLSSSILIGIIIIFTGALLTGRVSCSKPDDVTVVGKFMNEDIEFHNGNYMVMVTSATMKDAISIKSKSEEIETKNGNFLEIKLELIQLADSKEKQHKLDTNDFKIKDHTGCFIPASDIMGLFNMNGIDINVHVDDSGSFISEQEFSTVSAVKDYTWYKTELVKGEKTNLTLYYDMPEGVSCDEGIIILEMDFYFGTSKKRSGCDIALAVANRKVDKARGFVSLAN